jgi:hypothetical protein
MSYYFVDYETAVGMSGYHEDYEAGVNIGDEIYIIIPQIPNLYLAFAYNTTKEEIKQFKADMLESANKIKASPIRNFSEILNNGKIFIGDSRHFYLFHKIYIPDTHTRAFYDHDKKEIFYITDKEEVKAQRPATIIHELAHKFHHLILKDGFENKKILELYSESKRGICELPKIGDPLSNLREDWWTVRTASDEFYLKEKDWVDFTYENDKGEKKKFTRKQIENLIACPSEYSAKNEREFFAEMCVLITLNKVKPSQKALAERFLQIVEE